jgi:hypothetical protein
MAEGELNLDHNDSQFSPANFRIQFHGRLMNDSVLSGDGSYNGGSYGKFDFRIFHFHFFS